jgi:hypothetical protein
MFEDPKAPYKPPLKWTGATLALFMIGLLILIPSGLCTGVFGLIALSQGAGDDMIGVLLEAVVFGGPFILLGGGLVYAALQLRKRGEPRQP